MTTRAVDWLDRPLRGVVEEERMNPVTRAISPRENAICSPTKGTLTPAKMIFAAAKTVFVFAEGISTAAKTVLANTKIISTATEIVPTPAKMVFADTKTLSTNMEVRPSWLFVVLTVALGLSVLAPVTAQAQSLPWTKRNVGGPSPRYGHAMAYDAARVATVLFGGFLSTSGHNDELWEWNGTVWMQRSVIGPSARYGHAMAYDATRNVTVLFGGNTGSTSGETWEWNGTTWTQRAMSGPSARYGHAMAYDVARGVTVLFGGFTDSGRIAETWEWNGTNWTQQAVSGPSPRYLHAMAYDAGRGVTVLFGGSATVGDANAGNGETWEWNGNVWTLRAITGPAPRLWHSMVYDVGRNLVVLFGGFDGSYYGDSWEWSGAAWTQRVVNGPSARFSHAMAYDVGRGVTVLFGGATTGIANNGETWELGVPCPAPFITAQPSAQTTCPLGPAAFSVSAVPNGSAAYQWQYQGGPAFVSNWTNLSNGANIAGGQFLMNAFGARTAASLIVSRATLPPGDNTTPGWLAGGFPQYQFRCVVTNVCRAVSSNPTTLTICIADTDDGSGSGVCDAGVGIEDLLYYLTVYDAGTSRADVDDGTGTGHPDGGVGIEDLLYYLARFDAGC